MKFALATSDGYQSVLEALLGAGWKLSKLFISPGDWMYDNKKVVARALELGVAVQNSPISQHDLAELGSQGCSVLVVASYSWKVPEWSPFLNYAINFHPSPLPEGRGPYPFVRAILEGRKTWSVTCHKINDKFDQGDVLGAESFSISSDECHESLCMKSQMAAGRLALRVAQNCDALWQAATPQRGGSYWPYWSEQDRIIDFTATVAVIMRKVRAFGDLECIATVNNTTIFIHRASAWVESHVWPPGALVHASDLVMVVAISDGYLLISEWSFNPPGVVTANVRR